MIATPLFRLRAAGCVTRLSLATVLCVAANASGCASSSKDAKDDKPAVASEESNAVQRDSHSYAKPEQVQVTHVDLDLAVDFGAKALSGTAALHLERKDPRAPLVLDQRGLVVESMVDDLGDTLVFKTGDADALKGAPLIVELGPTSKVVTIRYRTGPNSDALQFLTPEQTAGKAQPFLFTQGQAILTRTWIPLQDSPGIRVTYNAKIRAPKDLVALMSAERMGETPDPDDDARKVFSFEMKERIPPYLIALAVGDLAFEATGPRTGVWAEPSLVKAAAWEFADTEQMMKVTEALYGPYRWGRYDILVLPPSFPFGGMENPRLTFLSPTVIAKDRTLVSIIAHELAHSWSGNLVTNATWDDLWLNEGFTSYIELRIMEAVFDPSRASLVEALGRRDLLKAIAKDGAESDKTRMRRDIGDEDPDDAISTIAYDKGSAFLRMLEKNFGRETLDAFLRAYFDRNAFSPMTTSTLLEQLRAEVVKGDADLEAKLLLDEWCYGTGLPENIPPVTSKRLAEIEAQAKALHASKDVAAVAAVIDPVERRFDWVLLLQSLPREQPPELLIALDETHQSSTSANNEIRFEWLKLVVANRYEPGFESLKDFMASIGRRRLIRPLYTSLMATDWGKPIAREVYEQARPTYHPLTQTTLDAIVLQASAAK